MQDAIIELESRIAFQDDAIHTLDRVVIAQQAKIDWLVAQVEKLQEQLKQVMPSNIAMSFEEAPPPHY